jgi:hypothetical protein
MQHKFRLYLDYENPYAAHALMPKHHPHVMYVKLLVRARWPRTQTNEWFGPGPNIHRRPGLKRKP